LTKPGHQPLAVGAAAWAGHRAQAQTTERWPRAAVCPPWPSPCGCYTTQKETVTGIKPRPGNSNSLQFCIWGRKS